MLLQTGGEVRMRENLEMLTQPNSGAVFLGRDADGVSGVSPVCAIGVQLKRALSCCNPA